MLTSDEQQAWEEITRRYPADAAEEPVRPGAESLRRQKWATRWYDLAFAALLGVGLGVLLVMIGAAAVGALLCLVVLFSWGLRFWWNEVRAAGGWSDRSRSGGGPDERRDR
ncbi:hypothetical protein GCM10020369_72340 [Cryptosporangium minutisporangium]|uniref:DUF3040 domain-containing protein n=1 Tax=Cryptosporangium minutisporangium TaxID=113569 RepID=A0ABP6TAS3_9ACTN